LVRCRCCERKAGLDGAVVGDGAVGVLGILSAKQMGAARIIAMSHHETRQKLALEFGATETERWARLTQAQAGEVITHLAFYTGWPNAFSALSAAKDIFEKRAK
jgi:threonine dehydrogenase-like Zn-dependent dehydrogenase